ncbi:stage III sporulation protein AF [Paenibacillus spiritus]|uniref:Stage III sporulation protein AF n=1 Tax=Paenibacillus spiritus TaxID=2496557 RepID=A0A5J5GH66_9BACL|nr:stage III sporulation protein AF [Paenibacillus spiritus]KAA9007485.1 stage III sporulation protein AF [Paenibacillus spiritus]
MSWLGGWLRELVLIVLMASFVEMLLPGKAMQRYARLVLSLLVLLTMLSPIVDLLKGNAAAELGEAISRQETAAARREDGSDLAAILAEGQKLSAGRQRESLKLAASEVAVRMKEDIVAAGTDRRRVTVTVALSVQKEGASGTEVPVISSVRVVLAPTAGSPAGSGEGEPGSGGADSGEAGSYGTPIEVAPIETVRIGEDEKSVPAAGPAGSAAEEDGEAREVASLLEKDWELGPGVVKVVGAGEEEAASRRL